MADYQSALARLYALTGRGRRLELGAMEAACARFGNPERAFRAVHVAGTNGKGTVSAFLSSMHRAAGKRVGLYTSPHLVRFAERIRIDGQPVADDTLADLLVRVLDGAPELTFFETTTLAAFLAFREAKVERAVLEVGLGGRLDATNVIPAPELAIITRVAFDHVEELGDTLTKIALEKAAIIKKGSKVIVGRLHPEAMNVVRDRCAEIGAQLVPLGSPEPIAGAPLAYPRLSMIGTNLAVAVTAGRTLGLSPDEIARGVETMDWPGRNELLHRNRKELTLLDCAHNPDGAVTLAHSLDPSLLDVESRRNIALVFGTVKGKNYRAMLQRLETAAAHRVYVAPPIDKAEDPARYAEVLPGEVVPDVETALRRARQIVGSEGVVVVTGSTFLVGAARALLLDLPRDPAVAL
ncbi:MAG TPA: folylpolyglutamate synthase/dihydrofolate synthase family protein [Polyangiaceae bacterium]|nr:folylpolyglutamate synthase/dihydrofolate synthase family protein [Polyangiaceae bacterium]